MRSVKYLTLIIPILVFFILEYFISKPAWLFVSAKQFINPIFIVFTILLLLMLSFLSVARRSQFKVGWHDLVFALNLETALLVYLIIQTDKLFIHFLLLVNSLILFLFFRIRLLSLRDETQESEPTFLNIVSFGNFLIVFYYSSSFYRLPFFVRFSLWQLALFFAIGAGLAVFNYYKTLGMDTKLTLFYTFFAVFILMELAWTLSFLPLKYTSLGLILALGYYILQGAAKLQLSNTLKYKNLKYYMFISICSVIVILLTSRWL